MELLTEFTYLFLGSDLICDNSAYKIYTYGNYNCQAIAHINFIYWMPDKN